MKNSTKEPLRWPAEMEERQVNRWFDARRSLFVKNMIKEFYQAFSSFRMIYELYLLDSRISFEEIDELVGSESARGLLWRLKDTCHQLWRQTDSSEMKGCLLDWMIGSLFHEAMKLKENIYMYQNYDQWTGKEEIETPHAVMASDEVAGSFKYFGQVCRYFMSRSSREISEQMENIGFMFGQANYLLRTIIPDQAGNDLLLRYLIENAYIIDELWYETVEDFFAELYPDGVEKGYCIAAASYKEGHWHEHALEAYAKALAINPSCSEAIRNISQLKAFIRVKEELMDHVS